MVHCILGRVSPLIILNHDLRDGPILLMVEHHQISLWVDAYYEWLHSC